VEEQIDIDLQKESPERSYTPPGTPPKLLAGGHADTQSPGLLLSGENAFKAHGKPALFRAI